MKKPVTSVSSHDLKNYLLGKECIGLESFYRLLSKIHFPPESLINFDLEIKEIKKVAQQSSNYKLIVQEYKKIRCTCNSLCVCLELLTLHCSWTLNMVSDQKTYAVCTHQKLTIFNIKSSTPLIYMNIKYKKEICFPISSPYGKDLTL